MTTNVTSPSREDLQRGVAQLARDPRAAALRQLVLETRTLAKELRAEVDARYRPIFDRFEFLHMETGERITNPGDLYLSDQDDLCAVYFAACDASNRGSGYYDLPKGHCPALMAENIAVNAERSFLEHCAAACGMDFRAFIPIDLWTRSMTVFMAAVKP